MTLPPSTFTLTLGFSENDGPTDCNEDGKFSSKFSTPLASPSVRMLAATLLPTNRFPSAWTFPSIVISFAGTVTMRINVVRFQKLYGRFYPFVVN